MDRWIIEYGSNFYLFDLRLLEVTHIRSGSLIHEWSIITVRLRQANFIRNV